MVRLGILELFFWLHLIRLSRGYFQGRSGFNVSRDRLWQRCIGTIASLNGTEDTKVGIDISVYFFFDIELFMQSYILKKYIYIYHLEISRINLQ